MPFVVGPCVVTPIPFVVDPFFVTPMRRRGAAKKGSLSVSSDEGRGSSPLTMTY
ncbi:hypothetical protein HZA45_01930 [Candidatus Peregrinibacteria bacterium]|nr:hypothetical protein [Candidatus Peregrinibacteria bacterium]